MTRPRLTGGPLAALASLLAACSFSASNDGTGYRCDEDRQCPDGQVCAADGHCALSGEPGDDGGLTGDGADAAPRPDGGAPPAACGTTDMLRDDFSEGFGAWRTSSTGGIAVVPEGGAARFLVSNEPGFSSLRSRRAFQFRQSGLEIQVQLLGARVSPSIEVVFGLAANENDQSTRLRLRDGKLVAESVIDGELMQVAEVAFDPVAHRYWRVLEDSGSVEHQVSPDGVRWTEIARSPSERLQRPMFALLSVSNVVEIAEPVVVTMDDVNGGVTGEMEWCSISTLTDDFGDGTRGPQWLPIESSDGCQVSEDGGELSMSNESEATCGYLSALGYRFDGPLTIEATNADNGSPDLNLEVEIGPLRYGFHSHLADDSDAHTLTVYRSTGGPGDGETVIEDFYDDRKRFWRIRPTDGALVFETGADPADLRPYAQIDGSLDLSDVRVRLYTSEFGQDEVSMDNLNTP